MILNYLWIFFFIIAFVVALFKCIVLGDFEIFSKLLNGIFDASKTGFEISIGLAGIMTLWLGILKIGENAGLINAFARMIYPIFNRLFPSIPKDHPSLGNMTMNLSANMLGLDNAATPLGLKSMESLQELNKDQETASDAQLMFFVLHASGLTIIPISIIAFRIQAHAANPADIFFPCLISTYLATLAGVIFVMIKQKIKPDLLLSSFVLLSTGLLALFGYYLKSLSPESLNKVSSFTGSFIILSIVISFIATAAYKKINVYESFIDGAKTGFETVIKIIPYLVAMLCAIAMLRISGVMDYVVLGFKTVFTALGTDTRFVDALPTAFMKPFSGSGARGLMIEGMTKYGADSFIGRMVCVIQGAADTTFYIVALYFGTVGIKNSRYAVTAGLFADLVGIVSAIMVTYYFFG